jgi:hypothetical protein
VPTSEALTDPPIIFNDRYKMYRRNADTPHIMATKNARDFFILFSLQQSHGTDYLALLQGLQLISEEFHS